MGRKNDPAPNEPDNMLTTMGLAEQSGLGYQALRKRVNREQAYRARAGGDGKTIVLGLPTGNWIGRKMGRDWMWLRAPGNDWKPTPLTPTRVSLRSRSPRSRSAPGMLSRKGRTRAGGAARSGSVAGTARGRKKPKSGRTRAVKARSTKSRKR